MASGDITIFDQFLVDRDEQVHDLETDEFKLAIISSVLAPTAGDAGPHFNGTGTTDESTNEVSAGSEYVAGGNVMATPTVTLTATNSVFDADDVSWAIDASGPTDCRWGIIYNNTDANKRCVAFVDFGSSLNLQTASIEVQFNASGIIETAAV